MLDLALFTTIHPGTYPFLKDWYDSVRSQTDLDFTLWIGIDAMSIEQACEAIGAEPDVARWVPASQGDTPAQVRERAWRQMIPHADAVIMADADDMLQPDRVRQARRQICSCDVSACALQLVDEEGNDLGHTMPPYSDSRVSADAALPEHNIFGLGNTTYRTETLGQCLPLPKDLQFVDWYLATQAWLMGARMTVDPVALVRYRQHENNTLPLLPPFTVEAVQRATRAVQKHFRIVTNSYPSGALPKRVAHLEQAARRIDTFAAVMLQHSERCSAYVAALNALAPEPLWWSCVAHPQLDTFWTTQPPAA